MVTPKAYTTGRDTNAAVPALKKLGPGLMAPPANLGSAARPSEAEDIP